MIAQSGTAHGSTTVPLTSSRKSPDIAHVNVSRQRANVQRCVRVDLLAPRMEWPRARLRLGETLGASAKHRLSNQAMQTCG
jgi:hypothetical protein